MSDDVPERSETIRSAVITVILTVVFLIVGLAFWAWSFPDIIDTSLVGAINSFNPYVTLMIEALAMLGMFIFLSVTVINMKLFLSGIRAGWMEVISVFIIVVAISWVMFGTAVSGITAVLSLGFVVYLYLLQE
ncbi:MAG: hypothetical protein KAR03_06695 [Candidatus Thorarchaeota archaeon]|nr:hypothetical protein [Candidatus Thorarchaeota archaeon]